MPKFAGSSEESYARLMLQFYTSEANKYDAFRERQDNPSRKPWDLEVFGACDDIYTAFGRMRVYDTILKALQRGKTLGEVAEILSEEWYSASRSRLGVPSQQTFILMQREYIGALAEQARALTELSKIN